jgi:serine/threonine protein phosphatase PrpC
MGDSADRLKVAVGFCSEQGPRATNDDYVGFFEGSPAEWARLGMIAAIADGVGGAKGGRVAAELTVRSLINGHVGQNELLGIRRTSARALEAVNRWINAIGRTDPALEGMACTLTALILRGRQAHIMHVGDTRLYRLRDERLDLLTTDHTFTQPGMRNVLRRAIGVAESVQIDSLVEVTRVHDRYLLCSDGVHGAVSNRLLQRLLAQRGAPEETARALVAAAASARTPDNATALVLDILSLPPANQPDLELAIAAQPLLPPPKAGATVDGFELEVMLSNGPYTRVFRAYDTVGQRRVILKFPKPSHGADEILRQSFLRERWIATRVRNPWVGEALEISPDRQSRLYSVMPFYDGETLEARLRRAPPISITEGLAIAIKLAKGIAALHRAGIIHRDIKPENVVLERAGPGGDNGLKLIDLGVARVPHMEEFALERAPGTPSYMAPELLEGAAGDELSDQFALGVTIYRLFSGAYPYGEIEPFSRPRFGRPAPLAAYRPDLPAWLDQAIARMLAVSPRDRFGDILELVFELEHGAIRAVPGRPTQQPLYERNPVLVWQIVAGLLAVALFLALTFRQAP